MQQSLSKHTHIGRTIDPRYPTNLAILIWGTLGAIVIFVLRLLSGTEPIPAFIDAFLAATTIVLVWALSREIDPEEALSAFVSALLVSLVLILADRQFNVLVPVYAIVAIRIVNRSIGLPAMKGDSISIAIFTGVMAFIASPFYAMLGVVAFLIDASLPTREQKQWLFAGISTLLVVAAIVIQNTPISPILPSSAYLAAIIVATLLFIPVILRSKNLSVTGDITGVTLNSTRVQAGQILMVIFGLHIAIWHGDSGILDTLPLWSAITGVALFPLIKPFLPKRKA